MAKIEVRSVSKIFGRDPKRVLPLLDQGRSKAEILEETGHTVGLREISLSIEDGRTFVVMGLSGSGKSTLIRHFNRLIDPTAGEILIDGRDVLQMSKSELVDFRRHKASMVFQRFGLFPHRTVIENVAYGLSVQGVPKKARTEKARHWIGVVGLEGYENGYPDQLSGGMQQRVGLARALCTDPDILLMDEAFSALDPLIRTGMQDMLIDLQRQLHKTIVFITHDLDEALRLGDRIAILKDGALVQVGGPEEILLEPADDYVADFVKDVNRTRVITAGTVAIRAPVRVFNDDSPTATLAQIRRSGRGIAYVVDRERRLKGIITAEGAERVAQTGVAGFDDHLEEVPTIGPGTVLSDILPLAVRSDWPIAVVEEDGTLIGVVPRREVIAAIADTAAETRAEPATQPEAARAKPAA